MPEKWGKQAPRGSKSQLAAHNRKRYMERLAREEAEVQEWFKRFDVNRSNKLERPELEALLTFLNPRHPPTSEALDYILEKSTEISSFSMHIKGDANGAVDRASVRAALNRYRAHVREQVGEV